LGILREYTGNHKFYILILVAFLTRTTQIKAATEGEKMNKFRVLSSSLLLLIFSVFSTALAQHELQAAWQEYQHARTELAQSFTAVDSAWNEVSGSWLELNGVWNELANSWNVVDSGWVEVEQARAIVASSLHITLYDSSPRITRWSNPRTRTQSIYRSQYTPWTPEPSYGSWADLSNSWDALDAAWATADGAWAELERAWAELSLAHDEVAHAWTFIDQAFQQTSVAFDEIDRAWNGH